MDVEPSKLVEFLYLLWTTSHLTALCPNVSQARHRLAMVASSLSLKETLGLRPEDFVVEEVLDITPSEKGDYSYYLLKKRNRGTLEVIQELSERLNVPRYRFGFCGLKDRRAITFQYLSIEGGPPRDLRGEGYELLYLGRGEEPLKLGQAKGNRFRVTLRGVDPHALEEALHQVERWGFPNYFGEQRFAGELYAEEPIALHLLRGDHEGALREHLCHHPQEEVREKLRRLWPNLYRFAQEAQKVLSRVDRIALKVYLKKRDPERALRSLPKNVKLLFFFSYQAHLWNRVLAGIVRRLASNTLEVPFIKGTSLAFYRDWEAGLDALKGLQLPYASPELFGEQLPPEIMEEFLRVLKEEMQRLKMEDIHAFLETKALGLKVFSSGRRPALSFPWGGKVIRSEGDRCTLSFFLPSGSYATILLRRLLPKFSRSVPPSPSAPGSWPRGPSDRS